MHNRFSRAFLIHIQYTYIFVQLKGGKVALKKTLIFSEMHVSDLNSLTQQIILKNTTIK